MKRLLLVMIACLLCAGGPLSAKDNFILEYSYSMFASDRDRAILQLRNFAVQQKGYVQFYSNEMVVLRLPAETVSRIRAAILDTGFIGDERTKRTDVGGEFVELKTKLKTKETLLSNLYKIFEDAAIEQTLEVEKELCKVVVEIEEIKGRAAYLQDRVSLARVSVSINVQPGLKKATKKEAARWKWMNSIGIENLMAPGEWK